MWRGAGDSTGVTGRAVARVSAPGIVRRSGRTLMLNRLVTDRTIGFGGHMALNTMIISGRPKVRPMRTGLRVFVAFHARVFFVAHAAALAVPRGMRSVQFSIPSEGMVVRLHQAMTGRAVLLFHMTLRAIGRVHIGFLAVQLYPRCL